MHDFRSTSNCKIQKGLLSRKACGLVRSNLARKRQKVSIENLDLSVVLRLRLVDNTSSSVFIYFCFVRSTQFEALKDNNNGGREIKRL